MPGGDKAIRPEDGKQFSKDYQPPNRGRKARVFSQLAKEWKERGIEKATPEAVKEAFEYLLALHLLEVRDISGKVEDEKNEMPMVIRLAAKELLGRRSLEILREMLDRAHGKSKQGIEHSGPGGGAIEIGLSAPAQADIKNLLDKINGASEPA